MCLTAPPIGPSRAAPGRRPAETLLHHTPGARGGVAHDEQDPEAYVHEGQPVLLGLAQQDVHLWTGMAIAAGREGGSPQACSAYLART